MNLNNRFHETETVYEAEARRFIRDGDAETVNTPLLCEHIMDIYINQALTMKLSCTPEHLTELTMGRLLSEGIICSAEDVEYLYICEFGKKAMVFLREEISGQGTGEPFVGITPTCCTANQMLNADFVREKELHPLSPAKWTEEQVFLCANRLEQDTPLHKRTHSAHSCFLLSDGEIVFEAEDIGRHNAIDKAIGWALLNDVCLRNAALFTSGRVPTDMILKVIRAGVSILISKETVTKETLTFAREYGLTLIGKARSQSFLVYHDAYEGHKKNCPDELKVKA